jgi:Inositol polyphosphate kinase
MISHSRDLHSYQIGFTTSDSTLCGQHHAAKSALKDAATTTATLGFRLSGCQYWTRCADPNSSSNEMQLHRLRRDECKAAISAQAVAALLARFFSSACSSDAAGRIDDHHTVAVHRIHAACEQLFSIADCAASCPGMRVFGCSALLVFDAHAASREPAVRVYLVDFAHAFLCGGDSMGGDSNLCAGLTALADFLRDLATERKIIVNKN